MFSRNNGWPISQSVSPVLVSFSPISATMSPGPASLISTRSFAWIRKILPRRSFVLMGPGRWGSRGDITLGVGVTYSGINNTQMLIEVARKKGSYVPDLSFGTHFFQDLVEAKIRYLALFPDEEGNIFNEGFFRGSPNMLATLLPEYESLKHVVRVIDVPQASGGCELNVLMNGERDQALGFLAEKR